MKCDGTATAVTCHLLMQSDSRTEAERKAGPEDRQAKTSPHVRSPPHILLNVAVRDTGRGGRASTEADDVPPQSQQVIG